MIYILITVFGLVIGSFLNVCICRMPKGESICFPPSHCSTCQHKLKAIDLIPVFSYIFLRGRCRYCNEKISIQYPILELLNAGVYLLIYFKFGLDVKSIVFMTLASCLIIISVTDLREMIIPNKVCFFLFLAGLLYSILGFSIPVINSILGGLVGGGSLLLLGGLSYLFLKKEGMGGGDIKLAAAAGLFLGWKGILLSFVFAAYIALVVILVLVIMKKYKKGQYIPFGPFLALAFLIIGLYGSEIFSWYVKVFMP